MSNRTEDDGPVGLSPQTLLAMENVELLVENEALRKALKKIAYAPIDFTDGERINYIESPAYAMRNLALEALSKVRQ